MLTYFLRKNFINFKVSEIMPDNIVTNKKRSAKVTYVTIYYPLPLKREPPFCRKGESPAVLGIP